MSKQVKQHQGTLLNVSLAGTYILHAQVCLPLAKQNEDKKEGKESKKTCMNYSRSPFYSLFLICIGHVSSSPNNDINLR